MVNKNFKYWTPTDLKDAFGLVDNTTNCQKLKKWIAEGDALMKSSQLTDFEHYTLDNILHEIEKNGDFWSEGEMKMYFLSPLFNLVNFDNKNYKLFHGRKLTAIKNNIKLSGITQTIIASGNFDKMKNPYFCFHFIKPEKSGKDTDARGQLLAEMLAAQTINNDGKPIYGCYQLGRLWFFATLVGKEFCFSGGFIADQNDFLLRIIFILRQLKLYIDERVMQEV
jgi:hypothetical protein